MVRPQGLMKPAPGLIRPYKALQGPLKPSEAFLRPFEAL
jgi:hypothetical protein